MKLLICVRHHLFELWCAPDWLGPRLQRDFPGMRVVQLPSYDGLDREIVDADIYVGWSLRPEQLAAARRLRWIHATAAGVSQLMTPELVTRDIQVTNSRTIQGPVVAEHVIAVVLALAKSLPGAVQYQARHEWAQKRMWQEPPRLREINGATLGLIGFGTIARETARRALALGMKVVAVREHPAHGTSAGRELAGSPAGVVELTAVEVLGHDSLDVLLSRSDYVVLAAPETPRTIGLMNSARLAQMRREAFLINVSRGSLLDEAALVAALRSGRIAGAALDVFQIEPLPADSPLWDAPNLLLTPHTAAVVDGLWERHYALIAENLRRFVAGRPLLNRVDKHEGY
jgi:phosphoglycerate dehydrogenase-like enzyme